MKIPKILAPAGSFAALRCALDAGCDAVYFGVGDFNMRATASVNFAPEDLGEIVALCNQQNVETNLTLNTLMYNSDLEKMRRMVHLAKDAGVSAVIAADMATILYARQQGVDVHVSTQVSISNIETVKFYAQYSDRLVLARELTLDQVAEIVAQIKAEDIRGPKGELIEIEVFAHGALCVSVSGRCAMSLFHANRSANRGQCTQICRRKFRVTDTATGQSLDVDNNYVMSSADLATIGFLPELVESGVAVLKFEGRGQSPEYVDTVIGVYREALDLYKKLKKQSGTDSLSASFAAEYKKRLPEWNTKLGTVFNRGLSKGYYMGRQLDEWAQGAGNKATHKKVQVGLVEKYYKKINVAQVLVQTDAQPKLGDELLIIGPTTGLVRHTLQQMQLDGTEVKSAKQGQVVTFKLESRVRENDKVYLRKAVKE